ncbi:hypothetical protein Aperf_G00000024981 [Anoplocephala perfoliata]
MWKIFAGLCIRRPAIVSPPLTPFQCRMRDLYADIEVQRSHLSAHEVRHRNDLERMAQMVRDQHSESEKTTPSSSRHSASSEAAASLLSAKDMELMWETGEKEFWCEIGKSGIKLRKEGEVEEKVMDETLTNTAWRRLDRNLILLTRQQLGSTFSWGLPVIEITGNATLRSAAEDLATSLLPPEAHWKIVGNAPVGVHKYVYRLENGDRQGVQMYFLNTYVDKLWRGENVKFETKEGGGTNFAWSTLEEMGNFVSDKRFLRRLRTFIVDY